MGLTFNNNDINNLLFNGNQVYSLALNGVIVWQKTQPQPLLPPNDEI